ncbi:MAG: outer membrane protein transport protein [Alphaproteobacteria bacterium]|nr:outer membrane protein transport protein [Alphaproteobacteria bacterium]
MPLNEDKSWWFGVGLSAPFGLGVEYKDDFFGRYLSTKVDLQTIDIQPSLAWRPNEYISIGGSLVFEQVRANFQQKLANEDLVRLQGDDLTMGYNLDLMLTPLKGTRIGLDYRSEINHDVSGRQSTEEGSLGLNTTATAKLKLPDIATAAIAQDIGDRWTLLGQVSRVGWNNFDTLEVIPETAFAVGPTLTFNYQNSWAYSIGAEYKASDSWTFRAGYQYDQTPTRIEERSALNPDGDRHWFSGGLTYQWNDKLSFDLGASYIDIEEERIKQSRAGNVRVNADIDNAYVLIGAAALNYKF